MKVPMRGGLLALALVISASGCGSDRVNVTGRVTYKGEPVPSTEVVFMPEDGSRRCIGRTDDDGRFTLRHSNSESGAPRGKYKVILKYAPSGAEESHEIPPKASKELKEVIARDGNPEKADLHYEITTRGQVIEINLD